MNLSSSERLSYDSVSVTRGFFDYPLRRYALSILLSCILIFISAYIIKGKSFVPYKLGEYLQLVSIAFFFITLFFLARLKFDSGYLAVFFTFYFFWALIVVQRGLDFSIKGIMGELVKAEYGGILYFVPLLLLLPRNLWFYKRLFDFIFFSGGVFLICTFLTRQSLLSRTFETQDSIETLARLLGIASGFTIMTFRYHSKAKVIMAFVVMLACILLSVYKARRGLTFTLGSVMMVGLLMSLFYSRYKILIIYLLSLIAIGGALYVSSIYNIENNELFNRIAERGTEDTRLGVELYFYNDMKATDWVIGRGMNGSYYCPGIDEGALTDYRKLIETGYLQIILKGGLIRLILFTMIMVPAIFLGLFFSENLLCKAAALWIVIALASLYPATVEAFSLWYILMWISVGICYAPQIRKLQDVDIKNYFKKPYYENSYTPHTR